MKYQSLDQEWDNTCHEMEMFCPKVGDKILCCSPEVHAGLVVEINRRDGVKYYTVRLDDGSIDEFAEEDVMKRKAAQEE